MIWRNIASAIPAQCGSMTFRGKAVAGGAISGSVVKICALTVLLFGAALPAHAAQTAPAEMFSVKRSMVADEKAVFATVESAFVVPARVRTAGTILSLKVRQGDHVERNQVIATTGDPKLALTMSSYAAQIDAAQAQLAEAQVEFGRAQRLVTGGGVSQNQYDQARTALNVADGKLKAIMAERAVVQEQQKEGQVLAPTAGRVIAVPVTAGTVVMSGDVVATVAERDFVLRLQVPERHARFLKAGDPVRLDGSDLGLEGPGLGTINLIYPEVQNGRVIADARVAGLQDYFVGQQVRVWVPAGTRAAIVVPGEFITTRFGLDYARILDEKGGTMDVPVQRGQEYPTPEMASGLEILSGLRPGDRLVHP